MSTKYRHRQLLTLAAHPMVEGVGGAGGLGEVVADITNGGWEAIATGPRSWIHTHKLSRKIIHLVQYMLTSVAHLTQAKPIVPHRRN